jgi:hypothetical protein
MVKLEVSYKKVPENENYFHSKNIICARDDSTIVYFTKWMSG